MNKQNAAASYNSGTSSETSETQSVEDNNSSVVGSTRNNVSSRELKAWKRMKDSTLDKAAAEAKRPPWRAVSISTLPKPDKNALLRAKLLDASRRLRAGKSSISVQTDFVPTKLMKEVNFGVQLDLIDLKDVGILTDGSFHMKREGAGEFVLTYSVSQMTEAVPVKNVSTQTLLPAVSGDGFIQAYFTKDQSTIDFSEFSPTEQRLLHQIRDIREGVILRTGTNTTESKTPVEDVVQPPVTHRSFLKPTSASWNFDYEIDDDCGKFFQPYTVLRSRPATSYDTVRKLIPNQNNDNSRKHKEEYKTVNKPAFYINAIDELILESNNLVDLIEDHCTKNEKMSYSLPESNMKLQQMLTKHNFPSEHWVPIIDKLEVDLAKINKSLKFPKIRKFQKLD